MPAVEASDASQGREVGRSVHAVESAAVSGWCMDERTKACAVSVASPHWARGLRAIWLAVLLASTAACGRPVAPPARGGACLADARDLSAYRESVSFGLLMEGGLSGEEIATRLDLVCDVIVARTDSTPDVGAAISRGERAWLAALPGVVGLLRRVPELSRTPELLEFSAIGADLRVLPADEGPDVTPGGRLEAAFRLARQSPVRLGVMISGGESVFEVERVSTCGHQEALGSVSNWSGGWVGHDRVQLVERRTPSGRREWFVARRGAGGAEQWCCQVLRRPLVGVSSNCRPSAVRAVGNSAVWLDVLVASGAHRAGTFSVLLCTPSLEPIVYMFRDD